MQNKKKQKIYLFSILNHQLSTFNQILIFDSE